jgi:nucleotide-binding universal stress UspA family protein
MKPIMLATDGSPSAEEATGEAIDLAVRLELPLLVVSVAHDSTAGYGYYGYAEVAAELRKIELARIGEMLAAVHARGEEAGVEVETLALEGLAGRELCRVAAEQDARLVVVGAHGWGRLGRLIHGSVSTYVLHHATTPVLVVHGDDAAVLNGFEAAEAATVSG